MAELLVSVAIIVVITVVVLFNQRTFDDQIALSNAVSEIEIEIRQAQVYGVSVREFSPNTDEFDVAYGVSFARANNDRYIAFADRSPQNARYDGNNSSTNCTFGGSSECLNLATIQRGNVISRLCVIQSNGNPSCPTSGSGAVRRLDVLFQRPNPDAVFTFINAGGNTIPFPNHIGAAIEITSPAGSTRMINIYKTGQISVQ